MSQRTDKIASLRANPDAVGAKLTATLIARFEKMTDEAFDANRARMAKTNPAAISAAVSGMSSKFFK